MICEQTVKKFCCEDISKIENYDKAVADKEHCWCCHHKLEINPFNSDREDGGVVSRQQLKDDGMYYNRPACELCFMPHSEHSSLHAKGNKNCLGKHLSEEHRRKISATKIGKHRSEETKKKISEANKGKKNSLGCHRSEVFRKNLSESMKGKNSGKKWWHLGSDTKFSRECPEGEGWVRGRK